MLTVQASNIGNTEASENRQGKGGDLRSKYYPTLTVWQSGSCPLEAAIAPAVSVRAPLSYPNGSPRHNATHSA